MADSNESESNVEAPGLGMRLTIAGISRKFSSVKNVTTETLSSMMKSMSTSNECPDTADQSKLLILDSRPEEEYIISHLPGAVRVEYEADVDNILKAVPDITTAERQSSEPIQVYNLEGSIFKWANEGRPMVDNKQQPTVMAHPYNAVFGKLLKSELRKRNVDD